MESSRVVPAGLRWLLAIHGSATLAAGIVLVFAPGWIPSKVGIHLPPEANLLAYLLAAAEFAFAALSFAAMQVTDLRALRLILMSLFLFHAISAALEVVAWRQGADIRLWLNVAVRLIVVMLLAHYIKRVRVLTEQG